jgi:tetratricopeptide (TPR) repeat protein
MTVHDHDATAAHLSTAIRAFTTAGQPCAAAMACVRLGELMANGMGNPTAARAWFARADRLVADQPPCIERGWVAVAPLGCDVDDPDELLQRAELALEIARQFDDVNLETKALADAGLALVQLGQLDTGMARLDEAMALASGPADDTEVTAKSVCSFFTACFHATDFERADSWATLLRQQGLIGLEAPGPAFLSSHCDSVHAALLVQLGRWGEAEATLLRAAADFESVLGAPSWHPTIALAELRMRQGRLADAEALLLGRESWMQVLLPAARLHLARGDHELAIAAARRGLRSLVADALRAAELLEVVIDAALRLDDLDLATEAAGDLSDRLDGLDSPAVLARAAGPLARLHRASGDRPAAIDRLDEGLAHAQRCGARWTQATLLVELARTHEAAGDRAAATVAASAAASVLAELDVVVHPDDQATIDRLGGTRSLGDRAPRIARLRPLERGWVAEHDGVQARLPASKGMRHLAELVARPGVELHVLDLVDRLEGIAPDPFAPGRRQLGHAGPVSDQTSRAAYRRRAEELRSQIDECFELGRADEALAVQDELDQVVAHLAGSFGLGGRDRLAASAAERARLNVTRAVRTAISRLSEVLPDAAAALDRGVQTGLYCRYEPLVGDAVVWIVHPEVNDRPPT